MADVTINFENKTPVELLGQGIRSYEIKDYNAAVAYLSKASELATAEHGDNHESLGDIYLYYGKALLEVSRLEGDPLGDAVPRVESDEEEDDDGEDTNEADTAENGKEQDKPEDAKTNGLSEGGKAVKNDTEKEDVKTDSEEKTEETATKEEENKDGDTEKAKSEETADAGSSGANAEDGEKIDDTEKPEETEDPTDLQLAWEVLELARVIFEKGGEKYKPDLADTYITLGEVSLESETFDLAIRDIKQGLEIQQAVLGEDSRTLAETYYKLGMAYGMNGQHDEAVESYTKSMDILNKKINNITDEEEIKEIKELLPEIEEKITDMKNLKDELRKKASESASSSSAFQNSPEKKATDISHLVKRKRKLEDITEDIQQPSKKSA